MGILLLGIVIGVAVTHLGHLLSLATARAYAKREIAELRDTLRADVAKLVNQVIV